MGKHHWKVEKQPEWYVKAVRKTIAALPGGYAEAADWLDVTENALFNRLRADGDQIFPLGWAMILQRAGGTHFIADAVAQSANGVFVSLPDVEDVDNADMARLKKNNSDLHDLLVDYYVGGMTFMSLASKHCCSDGYIGKKLQKAEGIIEGMLMALDIRLEMDIVVTKSN